MNNGVLKLPVAAAMALQGQLSPFSPAKERALSVEHIRDQDVLLRDILNFRNRVDMRLPAAQPLPLLVPKDRNCWGEQRHETLLQGEAISCFIVGGERRLCFPQVMHAVLRDVSHSEVTRAMSALKVHIAPCSREQLDVLKLTGIFPMTGNNCHLITKSDAERLCAVLLEPRRSHRLLASQDVRRRSIAIRHDCFGGAAGRFVPELFGSLSADCIECVDCQKLFAVDRFVAHSHCDGLESRVCHWGFDAAQWSNYLRLDPSVEHIVELQKLLKELKLRFDPTAALKLGVTKRTAEQAGVATASPVLEKKQQLSDLSSAFSPYLLCDATVLGAYCQALLSQQTSKLTAAAECKPPTPGSTVTKAAEAAAGLLALSNNLPLPVAQAAAPADPVEQTKAAEEPTADTPSTRSARSSSGPLKKHLLHQFEEEQRRSCESPAAAAAAAAAQQRPESGATSTASEGDDDTSLDALLERHVGNRWALKLIQAKIADGQRLLEIRNDSLTRQNAILQQEIAYLRNKQSTTTASALLAKPAASGALLGHC